jgi:hypothetical protein
MRIYFAVIATTADLKICDYDPSTVNLAAGEFPSADISDAGFIRFRKQLFAMPSKINQFVDAGALARAKQSTVFVVNVKHLAKFLNYLKVEKDSLPGLVDLHL